MPLQDWNDPATWANAYSTMRKASDPTQYADGYVYDCSLRLAAPAKAQRIVDILGINSTSTVCVIGAGFGWVAHWIALHTGCIVAAVDTSQYIQNNKIGNADIEIINTDVSAKNGRTQVKQALGISGNNKASFTITEDVIANLTDAECQQLSSFLNDFSEQVVHVTSEHWSGYPGGVSGSQDAEYNWKTIEEWKALLPSDLIVSVNDWSTA